MPGNVFASCFAAKYILRTKIMNLGATIGRPRRGKGIAPYDGANKS